jgi:hypothetical protein
MLLSVTWKTGKGLQMVSNGFVIGASSPLSVTGAFESLEPLKTTSAAQARDRIGFGCSVLPSDGKDPL